jgi:hypothetical protein
MEDRGEKRVRISEELAQKLKQSKKARVSSGEGGDRKKTCWCSVC